MSTSSPYDYSSVSYIYTEIERLVYSSSCACASVVGGRPSSRHTRFPPKTKTFRKKVQQFGVVSQWMAFHLNKVLSPGAEP